MFVKLKNEIKVVRNLRMALFNTSYSVPIGDVGVKSMAFIFQQLTWHDVANVQKLHMQGLRHFLFLFRQLFW